MWVGVGKSLLVWEISGAAWFTESQAGCVAEEGDRRAADSTPESLEEICSCWGLEVGEIARMFQRPRIGEAFKNQKGWGELSYDS